MGTRVFDGADTRMTKIPLFARIQTAIVVLLVLSSAVVFSPGVGATCVANPNHVLSAPTGLPTVGCGDSTLQLQLVMKFVFGILVMLSLLFIVIGGLKYTLSGGDSNAIASAKKTILYAVLGLVLGVSSFTIVSFVFSKVGT